MIKVSVLYPSGTGTRFDMAYYCKRHMRLVQDELGDALKGVSVDQGIAANEPGGQPPYVAIMHLYFDSVESYQAAFGPSADAILGDISNYTDIAPVVQISEVKVL